MPKIDTFRFKRERLVDLQSLKRGHDWPVVYLLEDEKSIYVGESISAYARAHQHLDNPKRKHFERIHIISDGEFNKSATLDTESSLIEYFVADRKYVVENGNGGMQNHSYFEREKYQAKFEEIWDQLIQMKMATHELFQLRNSDIFKYSPYKTLSDEQFLIADNVLQKISAESGNMFLIHGGPGTGKTILAVYLVKQLVEKGHDPNKIGLVIAMTSLRKTIKKVFHDIPGLKASMVVGPSEVINGEFDVLIVDEAHRLRRRKNLGNYFGTFDVNNKQLGLSEQGTELDWVQMSSKNIILFYDEKQSVRPSDVRPADFQNLQSEEFYLKRQMRIKGVNEYLYYIDACLEQKNVVQLDLGEYDFRFFDNLGEMVDAIKQKNNEHDLARMVAGYAWKWVSRNNPSTPDIEIGGEKLFWNSKTSNWVTSENAINEVGCIHTIQGYDLNYTGVIIGSEIYFDDISQTIQVDRDQYMDVNGMIGVESDQELRRYILNIYKTLLTRGILGTYVYVCDPALRNYMKNFFSKAGV